MRKLFRIISDVLLIILSATVGTFVWEHGSNIYNSSGSWGGRWGILMSQLDTMTIQYTIVSIEIVGIIFLIWLRYKIDDSDANELKDILTKIAQKLDVDIKEDKQLKKEAEKRAKQIKKESKKW